MELIKSETFRSFLAKQVFKLSSIAGAWKIALPPIEMIAHRLIVESGDPLVNGSKLQREDKCFMLFNVLRAAFKAYDRGSPAYRDKILSLFLKEFIGSGKESVKDEFKAAYGIRPPGFITISPEGNCNLKCKDCYASSQQEKMAHLSVDTVNKILDEKYSKWGSWFTVISGGEPFLWKDKGVDLIDLAKQNPNHFFMVYTNGTLIDKDRAERMAKAGNISPAVSVEGFEKETDARRGNGTYAKILSAFQIMRKAGIPFGISVTATKENADMLFTDKMVEFYMEKQGAVYQWVFQYMPIGRGVDVDRQIDPEVRKKMWFREQELVRKHRILVADFWNGGTYSNGCIAGGREDGYLYIDWNGNIYPCVFVPYWMDNINEIYKSNKTLTDALFSDLFQGIRDWQKEYSFRKGVAEKGNEIRPCFIRDHHQQAHDLFVQTGVKSGNEGAQICLTDQEYLDKMTSYDKELAKQLDPIWEKNYQAD
jgi:MoaA/NifB/PqqE/SkfB family radical SAM enzyme